MRGRFTTIHQAMMTGAAPIVLLAAMPAQAQVRSFDVPAQPASRGLPAFAKQAGIQILAGGKSVRGKRTNGVKGSYQVGEGLRLLLEGTGLSASYVDPRTGIVTVRSEIGRAHV